MDLSTLQSQLGYKFRNEQLLLQSLTHPSYMVQAGDEESSNQRLEFLGDAVLQLITSEYLYSEFLDIREGQLTQFRSSLVKGTVLAELANQLGLSSYIRVGRSSLKSSPQELPSSREDALEAVIGAIYLDSDFITTKSTVLNWYGDLKGRLVEQAEVHNPKGRLQERLHPRIGNDQIRYEVVEESGPSHDPIFKVELFVGTLSCSEAKGRSKKEAEEKAARKVLDSFDSFEFPNA